MRSSPFNLRVLRDTPSLNSKGITPMPIKLERWIRSYDSVMTTLTPNKFVPLAAQSRLEPEPYSLPAMIANGRFSC